MHRSVHALALATTTLLASCSYFGSSGEPAPTTPGAPAGTARPAAGTSVPKSTSTDVAALVPVDAIAYVEFSSLNDLDATFREIAQMADEPMMAAMLNVESLARMAAGPSARVDLLDRSKPVGLAVGVNAAFEPQPTLLLPCLDADRFAKSLGSLPDGSLTEVEGDYVVVSRAEDYRRGDGPHALATGFPEAQIVARVDFTEIAPRLEPFVGMGLAQARAAADAQGAGEEEMAVVDRLEGGAGTFLDSAETLEVAYSLENGELDVTVAFTAKEESPLAQYGSVGSTPMRELARYLDAGDTFAFCLGADSAFFQERVEPFLQEALGATPEGRQVARFLPFLADARRMLGTSCAVGGSFAPEGARVAWYGKPGDGAAFSAWFEETLSGLAESAPYMELEGPMGSTEGDVAVTEWVFRVPEAVGDLRLARVERQRAEMVEVFGIEEMRVRVATNGEHMALVVGGDDAYFQGAVDELAGATTTGGAGLERAVSWVANANPGFVATMDAARLAAEAQDLTRRLAETQVGEGNLAAVGLAFPEIPDERVSLTYYGAIEGRTWRFGTVLDLAAMVRFAKATGQSF